MDRLSIEHVASAYRNAKALSGAQRPAHDQSLHAAQSIPLNIAEGNGKQRLKDANRSYETAGGSARECDATDDHLNGRGKSDPKRIVSMLTRLTQRTTWALEDRIEDEYEYRDAEYEYEPSA